jgi:hypothetical protein
MENGKMLMNLFLFLHFEFCILNFHSVLNDFTGFASAALTAWKLTVNKAIRIVANPAPRNTHALTLIR